MMALDTCSSKEATGIFGGLRLLMMILGWTISVGSLPEDVSVELSMGIKIASDVNNAPPVIFFLGSKGNLWMKEFRKDYASLSSPEGASIVSSMGTIQNPNGDDHFVTKAVMGSWG
jgi:hypothetical protein